MSRINGPIKVYNPSDTVPTDAEGGYAGGDSTAAAVATAGAQALAAQQTIQNLQGAATTLPAGSAATVTVTGSGTSKVINVGIPKGEPGMGYAEGVTLVAAAQSAQADAAQSAEEVTLAMQAQFLTQDEGVGALVGTAAGPKTQAALEGFVHDKTTPIREAAAAVTGNPTYKVTTGPVLTFIDDDCDPLWFDIWKPICDAQGIKISVCAIAGRVTGDIVAANPSMNLAQVKAVESDGHDILSHGWTHYATTDVTPETLDADWALARAWMDENFPKYADVLVYPGGLHPTNGWADVLAKKSVTRKHFRYAITTTSGVSPVPEPLDNWFVGRINGDSMTEAQMKAAIDNAVAKNSWLVVMTHAERLENTGGGRVPQMAKLNAVIDYAQSINVPILPWSEAERVKGNAVAIGEHTVQPRTFVSHRGRALENVRGQDKKGKFTPTLYGSTVAGAHTYVAATRYGFYEIVNGLVFIRVHLRIDVGGWDAATSGTLRIGGLPGNMSLRDLTGAPLTATYNYLNLGSGYTSVSARMNTGPGAWINLVKDGTGVNENFVNAADVDATKVVEFNVGGVYMVSDAAWTSV